MAAAAPDRALSRWGYCRQFAQRDSDKVAERLTNAVGELEFRLSLRITQLLKNLAYDPLSVKQVVNDAYEIRSAFLHGDVLPGKKERKIAARYGDSLNNLLQLTLDFLRVSVIISITLPNSKEEFVKTLDESLWNRELTDQLSREIGEGISIANLSKLEN